MSISYRAKQIPTSSAVTRRSGRPPKSEVASSGGLHRERILKAALELIDRVGLAAFNIRDLATSLGVAPAAIYWHVPNRDALISGSIALALEGVALDSENGSWQKRIAELLQRFRAALSAHPHLAPSVASELSYNSTFNASMLDQIIAALEEVPFEGGALVEAFNVVIAAMCGFATLELSSAPEGQSEIWEKACRAQIDAVDAHRFPHLTRYRDRLQNNAFFIRWSSGTERPLNNSFDAWVDVLISGLESRAQKV